MTHRCDIQRDSSAGLGTDPYGNDPTPAWGAHLTDLPCRFWFEEGKTVIDGDKATELTIRMMIVPAGTDVTEDDRVLNVTDRLGASLADGPMRIDSVGHRQGHLVLRMVDVR